MIAVGAGLPGVDGRQHHLVEVLATTRRAKTIVGTVIEMTGTAAGIVIAPAAQMLGQKPTHDGA